jgi:hypothetical protein
MVNEGPAWEGMMRHLGAVGGRVLHDAGVFASDEMLMTYLDSAGYEEVGWMLNAFGLRAAFREELSRQHLATINRLREMFGCPRVGVEV